MGRRAITRKYDAAIRGLLIADHPEILVGEDGDGGAWILVKREAEVADSVEGAGRWALDHLFLDQDGVPTLVEVKRSSETRARREVVAQMDRISLYLTEEEFAASWSSGEA